MKSVEDLAREIIAREVVSNVPPSGGPTVPRYPQHARRLGYDLTGDSRTDLADVKALTPEKGCCDLQALFPAPACGIARRWPSIFDMYVNQGANAVRLLQRR
jgi:hypothetical protein